MDKVWVNCGGIDWKRINDGRKVWANLMRTLVADNGVLCGNTSLWRVRSGCALSINHRKHRDTTGE